MPGTTPGLGDVIQARVGCVEGTQLSLNVLHYRVTNLVGLGLSCVQLATQLVARFGPLYRPWMPITAFFESVSVQNVSPPASVAFEVGAHQAGTAIGNGMARQVSGLISHTTQAAGRDQRGRSYIGLGSSTWMDPGGILSGGGFATLAAVAAGLGPTFNLTFGGATTSLQLVIRHPNNPGPPPLVSATDVFQVTASAFLATQRRRGDFGRPNLP